MLDRSLAFRLQTARSCRKQATSPSRALPLHQSESCALSRASVKQRLTRFSLKVSDKGGANVCCRPLLAMMVLTHNGSATDEQRESLCLWDSQRRLNTTCVGPSSSPSPLVARIWTTSLEAAWKLVALQSSLESTGLENRNFVIHSL